MELNSPAAALVAADALKSKVKDDGAAARCGRLPEALRILDGMLGDDAAAAPADVGSYDAVLMRLVAVGDHEEALRRFEEMREARLEPIESHYRVAIGACASLGYGGNAAALLLNMQEKGMENGGLGKRERIAMEQAEEW